jgi:hypothetical protein
VRCEVAPYIGATYGELKACHRQQSYKNLKQTRKQTNRHNRTHAVTYRVAAYSLNHHVVCLATGPQPLPQRVLQRVRSSASYFKFKHLLFSLRLTTNCLCLLFRLLVPSIFPSITCFRRQFLRKMWPIQLAFLHFTVCMMFVSSYPATCKNSFL